jgi:perosamine synthetase
VYSPLTAGAIASAAASCAARGEMDIAALEGFLHDSFAADAVRLTSSGTHALQIALRLVCGRGSAPPRVALPAYSCFDLVTAAIGAGVRVRFYDVDPRTLSPDPESLRRVAMSGVGALVVGNLYGYPLDWVSIREIRAEAGTPVIEDAAQGVGTETSAGQGGTLGDYTVLSFGRGKGWTGGGGGAILARSLPGYDEQKVDPAVTAVPLEARPDPVGLRSAFVTAMAWALGRPSLYRIPTSIPHLGLGETHYHEPTAAAPIARFSAALAMRTAVASFGAVRGRRRVARALLEGVEPNSIETSALRVEPCDPIGGIEAASFLRLPVRAPTAEAARCLLVRGRDLGVAAGYPVALHRLPQAREVADASGSTLGGAEELASRLVTLPTHRWIRPAEIAAIRALVDARR